MSPPAPPARARLLLTRPPDSLAWMGPDLLLRLLPFSIAVAAAARRRRPAWLGLSWGRPRQQVGFGLAGAAVLFAGAAAAQVLLTRRRGAVVVPAGAADAALQGAYYALNGPIEEAFFRGLLQGGVSALAGRPAGVLAGTAAYILYHRLGRWSWADVSATALVGVPLAAAFAALPGPPSLLGVAIAHIGATCGFLGPGPWLLRRWRLL